MGGAFVSYRSTAASVRQSKERHPEQFCPVPRCLWRVRGGDGRELGPCGRHGAPVTPLRADQVLTDACPSLTEEFRHELLEDLGISASEAVRINALVREWQDEPNNRMDAAQRQAELRERILQALRAFPCGACGAAIRGPFTVDAAAREICKTCADARSVFCEHCGKACSPDDRLSTKAGGVAHAACNFKLTNAQGFERSACLQMRRGPAFRGQS